MQAVPRHEGGALPRVVQAQRGGRVVPSTAAAVSINTDCIGQSLRVHDCEKL